MRLRWIAIGICLQVLFLVRAFPDTLVVLNQGDDTASLIDLEKKEAVATLPTGHRPGEVAVDGDGRFAVITNYGEADDPGKTLTVIDIPEGRVIRTVPLGEYRRPHGIQWLEDTRYAVTAEANEALIIVDVESGQIGKSIKTDEKISHMVVLSQDGNRAFVANVGSGSVSVLDLSEGKRIKKISTGAGAEGITITRDGKEVWVTNRGANTLSVIDTETLKIIDTVPCSTFPIRTQTTPNGDYILVSNVQSGDIAVFDTTYKKKYGRLRIPLEAISGKGQSGKSSMPVEIVIHPDGKQAYITHANADAISIIDLLEWKLAGSLRAGKQPKGMGYSALKVQRGQ